MLNRLQTLPAEVAHAVMDRALQAADAVSFLRAWGHERGCGDAFEEPWGAEALRALYQHRYAPVPWFSAWRAALAPKEKTPVSALPPLPSGRCPGAVVAGVTRLWTEWPRGDADFLSQSMPLLQTFIRTSSEVTRQTDEHSQSDDALARPFTAESVSYSFWVASIRLRGDLRTHGTAGDYEHALAWLKAVWPAQAKRDAARVKAQALSERSLFFRSTVFQYPQFETHFSLPCTSEKNYLALLDAMPWLNGTITLWKELLFSRDLEVVLPALLARMPNAQRVQISDLPRLESIAQLGSSLFHMPNLRVLSFVRCPDLYDLEAAQQVVPPHVNVIQFSLCPRITGEAPWPAEFRPQKARTAGDPSRLTLRRQPLRRSQTN